MLARGAPYGKDTHMRTWLSERFGLDVPEVCAPMAGAAAGELAAAVSRGGGLGMIGVGGAATPEWISEQCEIAGSAGRPFGVGLLAWLLADNPGQRDAVLAARPALVSVSYGPYQRYLPALHEAGVTVATQAGTVAEAQAAEQAGVDVIVARGGEGGGHGRNDVATLPLLQMVLDTVAVPVLAAGGITGPRGLAAVLAAGAAGAWVGTAFLAGRPGAAAGGHRYQHRLRAGVRHRAAAGVATGVRRPRAAQPVLRPLGRPRARPRDRRGGPGGDRIRSRPRRLRHLLRLRRAGRGHAHQP